MFGISKKELRIFLEGSLNKKEKELLLETYSLQGLTFSSAVAKLSKNCPESTAKHILQRLKKFNLIDFGNRDCKGKPLVFTNVGNTFFEILRGESE